jgi:hydrogenase maturation protease
MKKRSKSTLVLGIGNILLSDEGIGVRVIEYLQTQALPKNVELVDGGTAGADLIDVLTDRKNVIIIDAADADGDPGTILRFTPEDFLADEQDPLSLHDLNIPQTLAMTHLMGCAPLNVICLAVIPQSIEPGMELTDTIKPLVAKLAEMVTEEIKSF